MKFWGISALALAVAGPAAADPDTPASFLAHAYAPYRPAAVERLPEDPARVFGGELLRLIRADQKAAHGEVGVIDGDILCDCQDFGQVSYSIAVTRQTATAARARVMFRNFGKAAVSDIDLQRTSVGWRIVDIHRRGAPSYVAWLRHALASAPR